MKGSRDGQKDKGAGSGRVLLTLTLLTLALTPVMCGHLETPHLELIT